MKRTKLFPCAVLLALLIAILGVAVYVAKPSENKITATVKINASNALVHITAYLDTIDPNNIISDTLITRSGGTLELNTQLVFDLSEVNTEEEMQAASQKTIVLEINNQSNKSLGVFFTTKTEVGKKAKLTDIAKTKNLQHNSQNFATATFDGYKEIASLETGSTSFVISLDDKEMADLETPFDVKLIIEDFQSALVSN